MLLQERRARTRKRAHARLIELPLRALKRSNTRVFCNSLIAYNKYIYTNICVYIPKY